MRSGAYQRPPLSKEQQNTPISWNIHQICNFVENVFDALMCVSHHETFKNQFDFLTQLENLQIP